MNTRNCLHLKPGNPPLNNIIKHLSMKILRSNNNNESQFHIMGLTSKEFYAIKHALGRDAALAADPDVKNDRWQEYEIENAINAWNDFSTAENHTIDMPIAGKV